MSRKPVLIAACFVMVSAVAAFAEPPEWIGKERPEIKRGRIHGAGNWKSTGKKGRRLQRWSLNVERADDGQVHGSIAVDDSPLLTSGLVRGAIDGRHLSGTIVDTEGRDVAEFSGVISVDSVRGTYTDRTGETGDWVWDGALPQ